MLTKIVYGLIGLATLVSYLSVKDFLAWPPQRFIIISNLTVSYVFALALVGGLSPWVTKRLWPKAPRWAFILVATLSGTAIVCILGVLGEPLRW